MRIVAFSLAAILSMIEVAAPARASGPPGIPSPGEKPALFLPGVVNGDGVEINLVFDREYREYYFSRQVDGMFEVFMAQRSGKTWSDPKRLQLLPADANGEAVDMALSPDRQRLYFVGITSGASGRQADIWVSERTDDGWSTAERLGPEVNTEHTEFYPTVVADGSLYFVSDRPHPHGPSNLFRAKIRPDGSFEPAVPTGPPIDTELGKGDTYVDIVERYIIISSSERGGAGQGDLFISFRTDDGGWTEPMSMGRTINTPEHEFCPMVSPDGRWLSFSRRNGATWAETTDAGVYWMDARIIERLW